jgi:hypothetical protein
MEPTQIFACALVAACVIFAIYYFGGNPIKTYSAPRVAIKESFSRSSGEKFYVYNYYKVPINVQVNDSPKEHDGVMSDVRFTLVQDVPSGSYKAITQDKWKHLTLNSKIEILKSDDHKPIGESTLNLPEGKTIKALHCGMVSGHSDIAILADITKSPLGTALPRLRIVNVTPRTINLTTSGGNLITIPSGKSLLYWGEYENGIHMGVSFKDVDGILPDYTLTKPITDLFLGIVSDIEIPLYRAAKIGGDFFDDEGIFYHPLRELDGFQLHRGAFIDKSYIPRNW